MALSSSTEVTGNVASAVNNLGVEDANKHGPAEKPKELPMGVPRPVDDEKSIGKLSQEEPSNEETLSVDRERSDLGQSEIKKGEPLSSSVKEDTDGVDNPTKEEGEEEEEGSDGIDRQSPTAKEKGASVSLSDSQLNALMDQADFGVANKSSPVDLEAVFNLLSHTSLEENNSHDVTPRGSLLVPSASPPSRKIVDVSKLSCSPREFISVYAVFGGGGGCCKKIVSQLLGKIKMY